MAPSSETVEINLGSVLDGRFKIEGELWCGGQGCIYLGIDMMSGTKVAVKIPRGFGDVKNRLRAEAELLSRISHPNIVKYVAHGIYKGVPYLVTEYIDGERLDEYIKRRGGLSPEEAYTKALALLDVLERLHTEGIVHRDFTPDNIIVRRSGEPVVIDFGAATTLTYASGSRIHHGYFSAPELEARIATPASDIYMWGVVLLSMLKCNRGGPCIERIERGELITTSPFGPVINLNMPLCEIADCGSYRDVFDKVFKGCLEADYRKRYQNVAEVKKALQARPVGYLLIGDIVILLLPDKPYVLGREGDIIINSDFVSRRHARISYRDGRWVVEDLCSTNGTVINRSNSLIIVYGGTRTGGESSG
ncbi:MAG: protein kinase domain-containing protein, partial [Pyrobaculum sp.]